MNKDHAPQDREVVTKTALAVMLGVSKVTATRLLKSGKFPRAFKIKTHWRIPLDDIEAFRNERK